MPRQTTSLQAIQFSVADGNWDSNRGPIQSIVLHTIDGNIEGANEKFNTPHMQVSAHYGVGLDGKLYQWVDEDNVAYHAGNYPVNQTSIGIEHEDGGDYNGVRPDVLYNTSAKLVADICKYYDFPADKEHIFRHQDVIDKSIYKGGTSCPDLLDTDRIISMAQELLNPPAPTPSIDVAPQTPEVPVAEVPVETPVVPETPKVDQTDTNTTSNTPNQIVSNPSVAQVNTSGQAGRVLPFPHITFGKPVWAKPTFPNWFKELILRFLSFIGIERVQK